MSGRLIYLDHAASTPVRDEVREELEPYLGDEYGNPSGAHRLARAARRAVDESRERLAAVLSCEPGQVIFTSGGTEADNMAVTGSALAALARGAESALVACSAVEHPAVAEPTRFLGGREILVDGAGIIDLDELAALLEREGNVVCVSVMLANNETGVVEPLADVAAVVRERAPHALIHSDAVQALRWLDLGEATAVADLVTVTAHKIGGPKGAGALVARGAARSRLAPLLRGGPQERELRAGTPNVAGIVGFAAAAELAAKEREMVAKEVEARRDRLAAGVAALVPSSRVAAESAPRLPHILNVSFPGIVAEELLFLLDEGGVAASAGSSCASGALEPSPVLSAMGLSPAEASEHVRFSLGPSTTDEEIEQALSVIEGALARLRDG